MQQIMQIFNSLTSLARTLRLGARWPQASSLPGRLCGSAARRLEALRRLRQLSLDFSLALILLVGIWRLIWGPCWNPFNTLCYTAPTGGDHVQHYYGWLAYARGGLATWLPPRFQSWTWPDPVPLLFADPIPLAAILLRPLARMLQIDFQYFSLLSLLSIVGSFLAGIWIGRFFALRSYQSTLLAVLLALAPPALLRLSGHEALSLHVVLVLALALVIRRRPSLALWLPLVVVSMGIHAYFTPMILGLGVYSQWASLDQCLAVRLPAEPGGGQRPGRHVERQSASPDGFSGEIAVLSRPRQAGASAMGGIQLSRHARHRCPLSKCG
jgi:hypothetical protein